MARMLKVPCTGVVDPSGGATVVGDPDGMWADDSDATYAVMIGEQNAAIIPDTGVPVLTDPSLADVTVRLRYSGGRPLNVAITQERSGAGALFESEAPTDHATPTWVDITYPRSLSIEGADFLKWVSGQQPGEDYFLFVRGGFSTCHVYEAHLLITGRGLAPPCRLYPADTMGSVGGSVRQFPPSKSRQRSTRGVGYY